MVANDQLDGNSCSGSGCYDGGKVFTVFFAVTMGAMALGQAGPSIEAITGAQGKTLGTVYGRIQIDNVPSRRDVLICRNYSLAIEPGETVALVGPSGSGKSTVVSLLERFYDPQIGIVSIDGVDEFPQGFNTEVGERGAQLSGGQKQRIAIASLDQLLANSHRTTVIVAHRLSTIRNADRIAVHSDGAIVEIGSHDELMELPNGHYRSLVDAQAHASHDDKQNAVDMEEQEDQRSTRGDIKLKQSTTQPRTKDKNDTVSEDNEEGDVQLPPFSISRLWKMSAAEWKFMVMGAFGAVVNAAVFPVWGVLLVKITVLFFRLDYTKSEMLDHARRWSLGFIGLAVFFGVSVMMQHYGFGVVSQRLVSRVRLATFSAMLEQEIGWFDLDENASGALVSRLSTDSTVLQAMTSEMLNRGLVNATTLAIAFVIAFYYSLQVTLILLAAFPVVALSSFIQAKQVAGTNASKQNNYADTLAGPLLTEVIGSIRTVASFGMESALNSVYSDLLNVSKEIDVKTGIIGGLSFGVSQAAMLMVIALVWYISGIWISDGIITFEEMFMVVLVIMTSTFAVRMAVQGATDGTTAKLAAQRVFKIIDRKPKINSTSDAGLKLPCIDGNIEFCKIEIAGSGKSTAISLLERFYDPSAGSVTLDGYDLKELNVQWLRENVSLVSQEPVLFSGTIAENISLGKPGSNREEIVEAAKKANAFDFISNFPNGFDTDVGDRGAQVSGGQKQRIATARAILRDPSVLLSDEATSALDNESERMVQVSLDRLLTQKQRTTIIVAHRLSTIRHADLIAVTQDGAIVEQGTHDQLLQLPNGIYKGLVGHHDTIE
ncbi:hypothetical protein F441_18308 [Phytophthora nicotianae CJ01A1]|uniref:Uncharacterized protein n=1 Tax=Phytophthora nicotianae CJ01A1 TaxID=1317063 RepID=W2W5X1_PHYNI|nr:hypothetical protein F441_18308 [Phytophthora nicotianae CJ01A1]